MSANKGTANKGFSVGQWGQISKLLSHVKGMLKINRDLRRF